MPSEVLVALEVVFKIAVALFCFGFTIFVHELGHFWVARKCGLKVDAFSIGFGPAIIKKTVNGILYKVAWIPLGGYVSLPQMDPSAQEPAEGEKPLPPVTPQKKLLVAVAGVTMNMILAVVLAGVIWKVGIRGAPINQKPTVGFVEPDSPAARAGFQVGDEIIRASGNDVATWERFQIEVALRKEVEIEFLRGGRLNTVTVKTEKGVFDQRYLGGLDPAEDVRIGNLMAGLPAEKSGLLPGDQIVTVDGVKVQSVGHVSSLIRASNGREIRMALHREREQRDFEIGIQPLWNEEHRKHMIGIAFDTSVITHPTPWQQVKRFSGAMFRTLRAFTVKEEARQAFDGLGSPVMIFGVLYKIANTEWMQLLSLVALVNVNLALMNLLPIPILDGGHVMFALYEIIARRRPSRRFVVTVSNVFASLLISLMIFLAYRDSRYRMPVLFGDGPEKPPAAPKAPEAPAAP